MTGREETINCPTCDGSGMVRCQRCKGIGYNDKNPPGECRACYGKGIVPCDECKGVGRIRNPKLL